MPGDTLDCLDPLGEPFVTSKRGASCWRWRDGLSQGIASHFKRRGSSTKLCSGFRNETKPFWADLFKDTPVTGTYHY